MNLLLCHGCFLLMLSLVGCKPASPVSKMPHYHGQSRAQIIAALGTPASTEQYPMSKALGEFRVELQNTYPLSIPANLNVAIEELTWQDGNYWITLWLHQNNGQWVVLDSCRWHKDIQF